MRFEVVRQTLVHEAPTDDPRGDYCEPRIARLHDGTILVSHRAGTRRESNDGRPHLLRTRDEGLSWEDLGRPLDAAVRPGWDLRGMGLAPLESGAMLAVAIGLDKSARPARVQPGRGGARPDRQLVRRSDDAGTTWSAPWPLEGQPIRQTASQGLLSLPTGEVLMTFETFKEYDEEGPWRYLGGSLRSRDEGRTWGEQVISAASDFEGDPHDTMWWDPRIARLADGTLVQFYYAFRHRDSTEGPVHIGWSDDDGRTWTPPASTGLERPGDLPDRAPGWWARRLPAAPTRQPGDGRAWSGDGGRTFDRGSET